MASIGTFQRRLEAIVHDFARARALWKDLNTEGFSVANKFVNATIQSRYVDDNAYWHPVICQEFPNVLEMFDHKMTTILDAHAAKLCIIVDRMEKQYHKMENYLKELKELCVRIDALCGPSIPLFKTCPMAVYDRRVTDIVAMYSNELRTQRSLSQGFRKIRTREEGLGLLSAWLNQPNLNDEAIVEFEDLCRIEMADAA